jgi:hypothetical protein
MTKNDSNGAGSINKGKAGTNYSSKIQSTALSTINNSLNARNLKIGQHGANMHYCLKKDGDLEEEESFPDAICQSVASFVSCR